MTNDSGEKPAKEWKILNGRLIQDINGFKQEIAMAVHQDRLDEIQGESTLVREVTPCANCERLEDVKDENKITFDALYANFEHAKKQLEMCKEALKDIADFEVDNITESRVAATKARICLKAIDKDWV